MIDLVNPVPVEELEAWLASMLTTFLGNPRNAAVEAPIRAAAWEPERAWGVRDRGRWVATLRTMPRRLTVPLTPTDIAVDALTSVTVSATHRRQGLLRAMLDRSLDAAKHRGDAMSVLIAAEWPIYGRFGYAPASDCTDYTVHSREPGARLLTAATGEVYQVEAPALATIGPDVFAAARSQRAGNIDRVTTWWDRELGLDGVNKDAEHVPVFFVHDGAGGIDGYVSWTSTGHWTMSGSLGEITVNDLMATNEQAYHALWQYLLGIDVVGKIHLADRPVDEPLRWLLVDGRSIRSTASVDRLWLRLLDVPAALSARCYSTEGSIVFEVIDPDGPGYAAGCYLVEAGPDGATCTATTRSPDIRLHQRALAAGYLGGFSLRAQQATGLVEELRPGSLDRADAMLSTPIAPWCATSF